MAVVSTRAAIDGSAASRRRHPAGSTVCCLTRAHAVALGSRVRAMLVEMVWRMIRWQPEYRALRKWMPVLGDAKGSAAARKKAVVAVARQLAVDLWRLFTGQTTAENLGLIYLPDAA